MRKAVLDNSGASVKTYEKSFDNHDASKAPIQAEKILDTNKEKVTLKQVSGYECRLFLPAFKKIRYLQNVALNSNGDSLIVTGVLSDEIICRSNNGTLLSCDSGKAGKWAGEFGENSLKIKASSPGGMSGVELECNW